MCPPKPSDLVYLRDCKFRNMYRRAASLPWSQEAMQERAQEEWRNTITTHYTVLFADRYCPDYRPEMPTSLLKMIDNDRTPQALKIREHIEPHFKENPTHACAPPGTSMANVVAKIDGLGGV